MTASFRFFTLGIVLLSLPACASPLAQSSSPIRAVSGGPTPPVAPQRPHVVRSPNGDRVDEYYWMRDDTRKDPDVLGYMRAENAYKDALLAPLAAAEKQLLAELIARIPQEDESVPARENGYEYWSRYVRGGEYPHSLAAAATAR